MRITRLHSSCCAQLPHWLLAHTLARSCSSSVCLDACILCGGGTRIRVDKSRLRKEMSRQASATVTTHHVHLFSCQLSATEMAEARAHASKETAFGNECETERTYIETVTLREAIPSAKLDFTTLGMIMQTIGLFFDATSPGLSVMASAGRDEGNGSPVAALEHMTVSALSGGSSSPSSVADEEEMLERVPTPTRKSGPFD